MNYIILTFMYIFTGMIGLCVGSFLNVVIYRVPLGQSIAMPPSHCPKCNYQLKWYDNIPVLSYIILGGKCRSCKQKISFRYTAVEILNTLLWLGCWCFLWQTSIIYAIFGMIACSVLICVAFIDLENMWIPDRFHIVLLVLGVASFFSSDGVLWWQRLLGFGAALVLFGGMYLLFLLIKKRECLGRGDIKLMAVCGLFLGVVNWFIGVLIATVVGSVVLVILEKVRSKKLHSEGNGEVQKACEVEGEHEKGGEVVCAEGEGESSCGTTTEGSSCSAQEACVAGCDEEQDQSKEYPFGTFLAAGMIVALLFGNLITNWYTSLFII